MIPIFHTKPFQGEAPASARSFPAYPDRPRLALSTPPKPRMVLMSGALLVEASVPVRRRRQLAPLERLLAVTRASWFAGADTAPPLPAAGASWTV